MTPDTQCVKGLVVNYFSLDCMTPDTQCVKGLVVNYFSLQGLYDT